MSHAVTTGLVSVVLPVRNGGAYLHAAVQSILDQSYSKLELLVVDDHSDDCSVRNLVAVSDSRLKIISSPGHGVVAAFNAGFKQATGEYVARMDADDLSLPHRLESQVNLLLQRPELDIVGGQVEVFSKDGVKEGNRLYQAWLNQLCEPDDIRRELFIESPIPNPTVMFRYCVLKSLGGYHDSAWPEDYDLFLRADQQGLQMAKPDNVVLKWRDHDSRLTRTDSRYSLASFQKAKAHYLVQGRVEPQGLLIWGAGPSGALIHDLLKDEGAEIAGFVEVHPRRIGGQKRGLPVWGIEVAATWKQGMILVAVGARGARAEIREYLNRARRVEGKDYLFVA